MPERAGPVRGLHVLACDALAGTEVQISNIVLRWPKGAGEQGVAILAAPGVLHARLRDGGRSVWSLAGRGGLAGAVVRLLRVMHRFRPDVVEAYGFRACLVARAACLLAGQLPLVVGVRSLHFTEGEPGERRTRLAMSIERALGFQVAAYDANSAGARDFLVGHGFPAAKFHVIPNGVDLTAFPARAPAREEDAPEIVYVARMIELKRHDILLRALAAVGAARFRCTLIGDGPTLPEMRALAESLGLGNAVTFTGALEQREIFARLARADVFVQTSRYEGMPGSVLEAMAAGLPVIGTDVNGTRELVEHNETGLLVPYDDVDATAEALRRLLADRPLRERLGAAGRRRAEAGFDLARIVERKAQLYAAVVR